VVSGRSREIVGTITPRVGLRTNQGRITAVSEKGTVTINNGGHLSRFRNLGNIEVLHSDAVRAGYPNTDGSRRTKTVRVRRNGTTVEA
jgi:hypothetical protein